MEKNSRGARLVQLAISKFDSKNDSGAISTVEGQPKQTNQSLLESRSSEDYVTNSMSTPCIDNFEESIFCSSYDTESNIMELPRLIELHDLDVLDDDVIDPDYAPNEKDESSDGENHSSNVAKNAEIVDANSEVIQEPIRKKSRKGKADPKLWKQNQQKFFREKGIEYPGTTTRKDGGAEKTLKEQRTIKPRCKCKKSETRHCEDISEEARQEIFRRIWQEMTWDDRKVFVNCMIDVIEVKQRKVSKDTSRRSASLVYHLKNKGARVQVCKNMFLATTAIGEWSVRTWAMDPHKTKDRVSKYYERSDEDKNFMKTEFLEKLPKLPSHYCRATTSKLYLESQIKNMAHLYELYEERCKEASRKPLCRQILAETFNQMNLSLFRPKKDQCDICVAHEVGNIEDEAWNEHTMMKKQARDEKDSDKVAAITCLEKDYKGRTHYSCLHGFTGCVALTPTEGISFVL